MAQLTKAQKLTLVCVAICTAAIPVWRFLVVPELEKIPRDFALKIEFKSYGKSYDSENNVREENQGKVFLDVKVNSVQGDVIVLDGVFDVRTFSGERIYRNERQYKADRETGKSIIPYGNQGVWIVFPTHMEKKQYVSPYFVRVDPLKLEFVGEDNPLGLAVYHYSGSDTVDASKAFSFEQGVPEERGITNTVEVDLWIEPISGHIVNIIDKGENFYHDPTTGKILFKRNSYRNIFTYDTMVNQVRIAQNRKMTIHLYGVIIPILLAGIALAMLVSVLLSLKLRRVTSVREKEGCREHNKPSGIRE